MKLYHETDGILLEDVRVLIDYQHILVTPTVEKPEPPKQEINTSSLARFLQGRSRLSGRAVIFDPVKGPQVV